MKKEEELKKRPKNKELDKKRKFDFTNAIHRTDEEIKA